MLRRLVALSAGVATAQPDDTVLAPAETLDGFGLLAAPPPAATGLAANEFAHDAGLAAPSARAVRAGERAAALNLRRQRCRCRRRAADAARRDRGAARRRGARSGRSGPWLLARGAGCCWRSTC